MAAAEWNLVCANGHSSYSPNPDHWVTTKTNQRFCGHSRCQRRNVPVRRIEGEFQYGIEYRTEPPEGVTEQCVEEF